MKKSELKQLIREVILESADNGWKLLRDNSAEMYRPKGKTWPMVSYSVDQNVIWARDNNSKHPSESIKTSDISVDGLIKLLQRGISKPHPSIDMIEEFISRIKKVNEKKH